MSAVVVCHDPTNDIKWLKQLGIQLPTNILTLDTQMIASLPNDTIGPGKNKVGLAKTLNRYDIPHSYLHNAGNDAYFTLVLLVRLLDAQFRKNHKVDLPPVLRSVKRIQDTKHVPANNVITSAADQLERLFNGLDLGSDANIGSSASGHKCFESSEAREYTGYREALIGVFMKRSLIYSCFMMLYCKTTQNHTQNHHLQSYYPPHLPDLNRLTHIFLVPELR